MSEFFASSPIITNEICPPSVLQNIKSGIKDFHKGTPHNIPPIKSDTWECILTNSFRQADFNCIWYGEKAHKKHKVGTDITVSGLSYENISCKSGEIKYNRKKCIIETLNISSYRTTKYKTIDKKLNYIDSGHEDIVYSLSYTFYYSTYRKYMLTIFTQPKFKELIWTSADKDYISSKVNGLVARINHSQSDQLWYKLDYDCPLILEKHEIQL